MGRPLWPPNYIRLPVALITFRTADGQRLPAGALETWADLRGLAWGKTESEPLEFDWLHSQLGKGRSTLCGHLGELAASGVAGLHWKIVGGSLVVSFDDAGEPGARVQESGSVQKAGPAEGAPAAENKASPESRTLDSPIQIVKELSNELTRGRAVQKSGAAQSRKLDSDPRTKHPAIQACRQVANRYPDLSLYDRIIAIVGGKPDLEKLKRCRAEWVDRGYNGNAWKWATEWYVTGIPERDRPEARGKANGKAHRSSNSAVRQPDPDQLERDRQLRADRDRRRAGA